MAAKFNKWSTTEEMFNVPKPAKHTVFVYGNAGGDMDQYIELGFWQRTQQFLTDHDNVRVVCMYKYGKDEIDEVDGSHSFTGNFAQPGDIVCFELTDKTDLNKISEEGMQAIGMEEEAKQMKICDPNTMKMFLEFSTLICPAEEYSMIIWGHGSGFYALQDLPGKYEMDEARATRAVMTDEWVNDEWMDMYEIGEALKGAGIDRLNTLMFHNCFMGNIESITEIKDYADYAHKLAQTTDDAEMKNISDALDQAFKAAIIDYRDISNSMQHLDHYTLSVNLIDKVNYYYDYKTNYP